MTSRPLIALFSTTTDDWAGDVTQAGDAVAYQRGKTYIWCSTDRVHLWVRDGDDGWADSGWASDAPADASGVAIQRDAMDEYVMMRFAELIAERRAIDVAERAIVAHRGNVGCQTLESALDSIRDVVAALSGLR